MEFTQEKWFKSLYEGKIRVSDVAYQLKVTSNKRKNIYVTNKSNGKTGWTPCKRKNGELPVDLLIVTLSEKKACLTWLGHCFGFS